MILAKNLIDEKIMLQCQNKIGYKNISTLSFFTVKLTTNNFCGCAFCYGIVVLLLTILHENGHVCCNYIIILKIYFYHKIDITQNISLISRQLALV